MRPEDEAPHYEFSIVEEYLPVFEAYVEDALALNRLQYRALLSLQALVADQKARQAPQEPPGPQSASEELPEAYTGILGARPGDKLNLETMGHGG